MTSYPVKFWDVKKIGDTAKGRWRARRAVAGRERRSWGHPEARAAAAARAITRPRRGHTRRAHGQPETAPVAPACPLPGVPSRGLDIGSWPSVHPPHRTDSRAGRTHQPACAAGGRRRRRETGVAGEPDELLTIEEVIGELRVPRSTFCRWRNQGTAPRVMKLPSGAVRIRRTALNEWLRGLEDDPKEHAA